MKKTNFRYTIQLLIVLLGVLPLTTMAQDREFYLRPSYWRPYDQRGINVFETSKQADSIPFAGPRIRFGAGFTQQFQNLKQENKDAANNKTTNRLYPIQSGFMTAQANLNTDVQLADGIRLNVTTYLSSRHHNEAWVKGGYIQFDKLPFKGAFWNKLMDVATIKVGHMEINYGDQHYRRSDGGQTLYNPFMDNYIVDAFTTEIGGEVYLQKNGLFGMLGLTNGMIKGHIDSTYVTKASDGAVIDDNTKRAPAIYLKGGIDKSLAEKLRVRVSGSFYHNGSSAGSGNTLYWGDRTGSNYQNVMEKVGLNGITPGTSLPSSTSIPWSGRINPGFSKRVDALMLNGFLKAGGLELFGTVEKASGRTKTEKENRQMTQLAGDVVYRFGKAENLFVGSRLNTVKAELAGITNDVTVNRFALAGGWFVTKNVLMKAEYVVQKYKDFPAADYRAGGKFKGYVVEAVVGF
ncbi:MAG: hypothetical protein M3342_19840 [Bacteroidota bacterium]|nr:hypothetical protein [Bacteroidota bacterium]